MQKKKFESPMDAALSYLTARMRTRAEVRDRLAQLGYEDESIEATLVRLEELRLIDDDEYASEYVRTRSACNPYSRAALKYQLVKHKVGKEVLEKALQSIDPEREYTAAKEVALREWRKRSSVPSAERKKKIYAKLCRSGFEADVAVSVCRELTEEEEAYDF